MALAFAVASIGLAGPARAADVNLAPSTSGQSPGSLAVTAFAPGDVLLVSVSLNGAPAGTTFSFGTSAGLTASYGYSFSSTMVEMNFTGTQANTNAALASMLLSTGSVAGDFTINITATPSVPNTYYYPTDGDYYRYVASPVSWTTARSGALALTYNGAAGYLANITTAGENEFVKSKVNAANVWIGASDAAVEDVWRWMDGPEAGIQFWQGQRASLGGFATPPFNYAAWNTSEPNNNGGTEHYAVTNWRGTLGEWNDVASPSIYVDGYLVEFSPPMGGWTGVTSIIRTATVDSGGSTAPSVPIWTITYDSNGGSCSATAGRGPDTSWLATPGADACTRSGYEFIGWNTSADGSGTGFTPGAQTLLSGDNTLFAQWKAPSASTASPATQGPSAPTQAPPAETPTPSSERSAVRVVYFESGSAVLSETAKAKLRALVAKTGTSVVQILTVGYVQESGSTSNDKSLSLARAQSVTDYLRSLGVRGRYMLRGEGISGPRASDRRATTTITYARR